MHLLLAFLHSLSLFVAPLLLSFPSLLALVLVLDIRSSLSCICILVVNSGQRK